MAKEKTQETTKENQYKKELQKLRNAFNNVAKTSSGKVVFRYLMKECGFNEPAVVASCATGEINPLGSIYNEARRDVYMRIRKFLSKENIISIEFKEDEDE
jgi:hypothetical protein